MELNVTLPPEQKETGPLAVITGVGPPEVTVTVTAGEVALFPEEPVTVTEYDPGVVTTIELVVCPPGLHRYVAPVLAVSVTLPPEQKLSGPVLLMDALTRDVLGMSEYRNH